MKFASEQYSYNFEDIIKEIKNLYPFLTNEQIYHIINKEFYVNTINELRKKNFPQIIPKSKIDEWNRQSHRTPAKRLRRREYLRDRNEKVKEYRLFQNYLTRNYDFNISSHIFDVLNSPVNTISQKYDQFSSNDTKIDFLKYFQTDIDMEEDKTAFENVELNTDIKEIDEKKSTEIESYEEDLLLVKKNEEIKGFNDLQVKSISLRDFLEDLSDYKPVSYKKKGNTNGNLLDIIGIGDLESNEKK